MKKLIILIGLLFFILVYVQIEVIVGVIWGKDYGVIYVFFKIVINIEVKVNKVIYILGEFSKYVDCYFWLIDVLGEFQEYWELVSVKVKFVGIFDSEYIYFVKLKDKIVVLLIELIEDGIVKLINVLLFFKKLVLM